MTVPLRTILLVDDNPDDYEATLRSLRANHLLNPVVWCKSGLDAKHYLYKEGKYAAHDDVQRPIFILLDLNMPGLDGRQLLKIIKSEKTLQSIPVIVLTTSNDPNDVEECYSLGASTYIQKPVQFEGLVSATKTLKDYWFDVAILPTYQDNTW